MGKAKRWFKRLVAKLRSDSIPKDKRPNQPDSRRTATVANSSSSSVPEYGIDDAGKQAIEVRLNSSRRCFASPSPHISVACARKSSAAITIQSHFRGYLARRALRALKGLVKLQALVRGHITRKKAAETIRCIEAMLRAQARAISMRSYGSPMSSEKTSQIYHPGPQTPEKLEMSPYSRISSNTQSPILSKGSGSMSRSVNRVIIHPNKTYLNSPGWSELQLNHNQRTTTTSSTQEDKVLEIDTANQQHKHNLFYDPLKNLSKYEKDESVFFTDESSPQLYYSVSSKAGSTSSRRQSPMSQTKSDTSAASCMSGYSECPSYMAYTESSKAKVRASSVPRQRLEKCNKNAISASTRASFASKTYTGSGRFDRLGVMARNKTNVFYSGCLN